MALQQLRRDDNGASFMEYTALLGIIMGTALIVFSNVGSYSNTLWERVESTMADALSN
jgi:Flp pilus assembly pilin Flp